MNAIDPAGKKPADYPIISADSHVMEPPNCYRDYIEARWKDRAPTVVEDSNGLWAIVEGFPRIRISSHFGAGRPPEARDKIVSLAEIEPSAWDPSLRAADQARDGVAAEVLYPSIGMLINNLKDLDYQAACFAAYNRWLAQYCSYAPKRLLGAGQTALRTPKEGIAHLKEIKSLGLSGVSMPGYPGIDDYDSPIYDEFWEAAVELDLVVGFHVVAVGGGRQGITDSARGPKINAFMRTMRGLQDLLGVFVFCGVFQRHPKLKIVAVEGDAGWVPHFMHRLDRAYVEHRHNFNLKPLEKMPSEYLREHVYFTFQDDPTAWDFIDHMNWHRLLWGNDFPHSDATWPNSQALLARQAAAVPPEKKKAVLCDNAAALYRIDVGQLKAAAA